MFKLTFEDVEKSMLGRRIYMGAIMDIYQLIRDLIDEARKERNLEMVDQLIEIKLALLQLQDENTELKRRITELEQEEKIEEDLELQSKGYYIRISEKEKGIDVKYCVACWQNTKKLMVYSPLSVGRGAQCCNCHHAIRYV